MKNIKVKLLFLIIIILGFSLRVINIDWDKGHIFHPDERAIVMSTTNLTYPNTLNEFLTPESSFNTNFFAYGNLPIYMLKIFGDILSFFNPIYSQYGGIYLVGRIMNVIISTLTIVLVFIYAKNLFNIKIALTSAFLYSIAIFPIQNAHFFTVDTLLTFFILLSLIILNKYIKNPGFRLSALIGIYLGFCLATKISSAPIILTIILFLVILKITKQKKLGKTFLSLLTNFSTITFFSLLIFVLSQPYTVIDYKNFIDQIIYQSKMGTDPFVFPYTLQYAGKIHFIYELQNITLWGLGTPIGILSIIGYFILMRTYIKDLLKYKKYFPILFFTISFFVINSSYAVGWMRYLLPIYPLLTIFAGVVLTNTFSYLAKYIKGKISYAFAVSLVLILCSLWTIFFIQIYINPHTKFEATDWINQNIPSGSTIAIEHWDDQLPVYGTQFYIYQILPIYDQDTKEKWKNINNQLSKSDYLILASNRLYTPLSKLTKCDVLPEHRCYPLTAKYYDNLFSEKLGFVKVAEFSSYPKIPILNIEINDQAADESFTVYDHPKITIFKKI